MEANNTSAFNCRQVVGNPYKLSPHSYGTSIDVNPVQNPYRDINGSGGPRTASHTLTDTISGRDADQGFLLDPKTALVRLLWVASGHQARTYQHFEYRG
jgi:hypothetical protein